MLLIRNTSQHGWPGTLKAPLKSTLFSTGGSLTEPICIKEQGRMDNVKFMSQNDTNRNSAIADHIMKIQDSTTILHQRPTWDQFNSI